MLCEAKLPLFWSINWLTQRDVLRDVLHALMCWGRLVTSNGGRIYEHAIKRVVVGLIPLKLHPKRFWKKGNLVKIKRNNLKSYISSYLCPKNDLPGRWEAMFDLRSKTKWYCPPGKWFYSPTPLPSGISWASDPPTPLEFPIPSVVGVWIFSGTTQS